MPGTLEELRAVGDPTIVLEPVILAIPVRLLVKAVLMEAEPTGGWALTLVSAAPRRQKDGAGHDGSATSVHADVPVAPPPPANALPVPPPGSSPEAAPTPDPAPAGRPPTSAG